MQIILKQIKQKVKIMTNNASSKLTTKLVMKKIFGFMILFGLGTMLFSQSQNNVYAQSTDSTIQQQQDDKIIDANDMMNSLLKFIYALLWPVLFIAGIALDNTLVYGSFLHLDASLWSLRNIMKNFANFALGFMVLFSIVRSVFSVTSGNDGERSPMKIIKKTLIAGILIQMSWFLMAATIDISTILTYSVGGLPMTVLQNNPEHEDRPILGIKADLKMSDEDSSKMDLDYYSTYGDSNIVPCLVKEVEGLTGSYIVGREKVRIDDDNLFNSGLCMLGAWPYRYKEHYTGSLDDNDVYKTTLNSKLSVLTVADSQNLLGDCSFIPINGSNLLSSCKDAKFGALENKDEFFTSSTNQTTLDTLLEKSKGFVGPFITIYSSLLDFSTIVESPDTDNGIISNFFELLIKVLFAAALFFPLVALAIVLIARIGILWLAIATSPIVALLSVFGKLFGVKMDSGLFTYFDIKNLVKLIFAPVFVVFAISMSLIFLTALSSAKNKPHVEEQYLSDMGIEKTNDKTYSVLGLVDIKMDGMKVDKGMDTFAWMITNLFAIGIVWFFLFFAVKMTKIGESVGGGIQKGMQELIGRIPIVPIGNGVGVRTMTEGLSNASNNVGTVMAREQNAALQKQMPWLFGPPLEENTGGITKSAAIGKYNEATVYQKEHPNASMTESFSAVGLTSEYQDVLKEIDNSYVTENTFNNYTSVLGGDSAEEKGITTYDAENLSNGNIENMANSGGKWGDWAKGVLGGNVKTAGGTFVMVNQGTHANPTFKLVSQDDYSKDYLGQTDDGKYDEKKSNDNIRAKIEAQYIKEHGEMESMKEEIKKEMDIQITAQQKETSDRMDLLNKKDVSDESSGNNNTNASNNGDSEVTTG